MTDDTERRDPLLVRPYVGPGPEQTAEQPAFDEVTESEQPTAVQPAIVLPPLPSPSSPSSPKNYTMHWSLRLLVLVIGVAVALGIAAYFIRGAGSHDDAGRGPSASLPAVGPAAPPGDTAPASAKPSVSASVSASSSPSASAPSSATPSVKQSASQAQAPATQKPTLAPPPASAQTGRISAASGRCLALGGLLGIDGSPIQTVSCGGGTAQKFTLATDGTLQVASRCTVASGDGSVRSGGCGGAGAGGQWRAGPNGSLVNPSSGLCLTDPGKSGATTAVGACTGGDSQRWSIP
jgi:hypothetical protein